MNHLFIRSDLCRNRVLKTIEFGFQFEDLCFRYIPPNIRKDFRVKLSNNEFGDFNFLSNQNWLNNEGFFYGFGFMVVGHRSLECLLKSSFRFFFTCSDELLHQFDV